jgi:mannose/cellobiose epimerase-like protein (N-acyl-D-glucosamine 2-epimerase family)
MVDIFSIRMRRFVSPRTARRRDDPASHDVLPVRGTRGGFFIYFHVRGFSADKHYMSMKRRLYTVAVLAALSSMSAFAGGADFIQCHYTWGDMVGTFVLQVALGLAALSFSFM